MAGKYPSIPDPGATPETQLAALRAMKNVLDLIVANSTGVTNAAGVGRDANTFALATDVNTLVVTEASTRSSEIKQTSKELTSSINSVSDTVDQVIKDAQAEQLRVTKLINDTTDKLNKDISDANTAAANARSDALKALDEFETNSWDPAEKAMDGRIVKSAAFMGLNEATWKEGDISVATRFSAMSTSYKEYIARTGDDFLSSYTSHLVTTTTFDRAVATKVDNLETKLLVPTTSGRDSLLLTSAILKESNSTTDAQKKISTAQDINTSIASLFTDTGRVTAAVKVESDARADAFDNVTSQYTISVSAESNGTKSVTGLQLISDTSSGQKLSAFNVQADYFNIYKPGYGALPVVTVGTFNGNNALVLNGDLIADGAITARSINVTSLSAIKADLGTITAGTIIISDNT